MSPESYIAASPHLRFSQPCVLESAGHRYALSALAHDRLSRLLPHLEGANTLKEAARLSGMDLPAAGELLKALESEDFDDLTSIIRAPSGRELLSEYYRYCDKVALDIFSCPLWQEVLAGTASRLHVLGWTVEFYHRTVGADRHNAVAVASCADPEIHAWLHEHFSEELGHGEMFLKGFEAAGLPKDNVQRSLPLPSTQSLIAHFEELARTDSIAYLGCYGVLHSPRVGQTIPQVHRQFDRLIACYPYAAPVFEAIREHTLLDLQLGHDQIVLERLAGRENFFEPAIAKRIVRGARSTVGAFNRFFEGIYDAYAAKGPEDGRAWLRHFAADIAP